MAKRVIETGQRYRDVSLGAFERPGGIGLARLAKVANPSVRKTFVACALADPSRFEAV